MWYSLSDFYRSKEWTDFRKVVIAGRLVNGLSVCEYCHKPIVKPYDLILHHIEPLSLQNVNNLAISLNENNIQTVHQACHNAIHNRWGSYTRHVYLVYGAPLSGKTVWVNGVATKDDIVVDVDSIRQAITGGKAWDRSNRVNDNLFGVRDCLLDMIRYRRGKWINAFIVGTYPYTGERERIAKELQAELLYIEATEQECLNRLMMLDDGRDKKEWEEFIRNWFRIATPPRLPVNFTA